MENPPPPQPKRPAEGKSGQRKEKVNALRTFEGDVADALKNRRTTAAQIVMAEQERPRESREQTAVPPPKPPRSPEQKRTLLIISGVVFIAGVIVFVAYLVSRPAPPPPAPATSSGKTLIDVDTQKTIDLTGLTHEQIINAIANERDTATLRINSAENIVFTQKNSIGTAVPLNTQALFAAIAPNLQSGLARSLDSSFAFGLLGFNGNQPYLILHTNSYQDAYGGMLDSEVDLYREAGRIFVPGSGPLPSLSTSTAAYFGVDPQRELFHDAVVDNIDARVVKDTGGVTVFLYAFPNQSTLIITTNEQTFTELVNRLRRAQLL